MCDKIPFVKCNCKHFDYNLHNENCPPICHFTSICKLSKLLEEPESRDLYEQQIYYLSEYVKASRNGFHVNDLMFLTKVLEILSERINIVPFYGTYLRQLIYISRLPPRLHNCTEKILGIEFLSEYLTGLGMLTIWLTNIQIRRRVYASLLQFLTTPESKDVTISKPNFIFDATAKSHLPEIITQLFNMVNEDEEYIDILNIALVLSETSVYICQKMVYVNALNYILVNLLPNKDQIGPDMLENILETETYSEILELSWQILLNLVRSLRGLDESVLKSLVPNENSIWSIRYILRMLLLNKNNKPSRNCIMEFILLCFDIFPYVPFSECYLTDDLVLLTIATETNVKEIWIKDIQFTNSNYDLIFKKMLLMSLTFLEKYPTFKMIYENKNVMSALLKIISFGYVNDWYPDHFLSIKKYVLVVLYSMLPQMLKSFLEYNGVITLLMIIENYAVAPDESNKELIEEALQILVKLTETKDENFINMTRYHCGIPVLKLLCNSILDKDQIKFYEQKLLSCAFHILHCLSNIQHLPTDTSLDLIIKYFQRIIKPHENDTVLDPQTVISCIDYLWLVIYIDREKLKSFVKMEGVYLLLDIIEMTSLPVQVIGLSCLVDICEEEFTIPCLLTWRGGHDKKLILFSLLARIFRMECRKIGVRLDANDIIEDIDFPLMGKTQYEAMMSPEKDVKVTMALDDMYSSARPKIYALIQLLKTRFEEKVQLTNEHYKISNLPLSTNDQIILHLAENFFALKLAEVWNELACDLDIANITPISIDARLIIILTDNMQTWNEGLKVEQENILRKEMRKKTDKEYEFYDNLKKCRLAQAIDALREMKYLVRTTDVMFRLSHKQRQTREVENSLAKSKDPNYVLHRTYMANPDVTAIFNLKYNLQYNEDTV